MEALIRVFDRLRVIQRRVNCMDERLKRLENLMPEVDEPQEMRVFNSAATGTPIPISYGPGAEELTREQMSPTRWRLSSDNDGHYYLFPDDKRKDWWDWVDSRSEDVPDWAKRIDGYTHFTFTDPQEDQ